MLGENYASKIFQRSFNFYKKKLSFIFPYIFRDSLQKRWKYYKDKVARVSEILAVFGRCLEMNLFYFLLDIFSNRQRLIIILFMAQNIHKME